MMPFAGLLAALQGIPDPRRRQGQRYPLAYLLLFSVLAVLAGATSYRRIRLSIGVHRERLRATFGARFRRAPAVDKPRALLQPLDPAEIAAALRPPASPARTRPRSSPPPAATPSSSGAPPRRGGGAGRWTARRCAAASTTW